MVAKGEGCGGGKDWEFGVSRCKLLCIEWINNKVPLYNTGNYIQYPVINHNGKYKKELYICITESLCCTAVITQHCKSTILQFKKKKEKKRKKRTGFGHRKICV